MSAVVARRGTTSGRPLVAQPPGLSWCANQSGSIQTSATQSAPGSAMGGVVDGSWPVVKS